MEDVQTQRRLAELAKRAGDMGRYVYTPFLNLMELDLFARMEGSMRHIPYSLWGGWEGAQRKLIRFGDAELCGYEEAYPVACIRMAPSHSKFADDLTHRDFLGALMNLGIDRGNLGDILVEDKVGYCFCLERIAEYIVDSLDTVRRTTIACTREAGLPELLALKTETVRIQVTSERVDAVVAHLYRLSRAEAQALFVQGKVFVNDRLRESTSYAPRSGEVISVRGYGRFIYRGVVGATRKGKCVVEVEQYI